MARVVPPGPIILPGIIWLPGDIIPGAGIWAPGVASPPGPIIAPGFICSSGFIICSPGFIWLQQAIGHGGANDLPKTPTNRELLEKMRPERVPDLR